MAVGFPVGRGFGPTFDFDFLITHHLGHMKNNELRRFQYLRSDFPNCQLNPSSTVLEIQIKKYKRIKSSKEDLPTKVPKGATRFRTWKMGKLKGDVYLDCHPGLVGKPEVVARRPKNVEGCGIERILIGLCMFEKKIHNTKLNRKNKALKTLEQFSKFKKELKWMKSQCSQVVMLKTGKIAVSTRNYLEQFLEDAVKFGYTIMVIKVNQHWQPNDPEALYPKAGPCDTNELASYFEWSELGGELNIDGPGVLVTGFRNDWFFCRPTKKRLQQGPLRCKK